MLSDVNGSLRVALDADLLVHQSQKTGPGERENHEEKARADIDGADVGRSATPRGGRGP